MNEGYISLMALSLFDLQSVYTRRDIKAKHTNIVMASKQKVYRKRNQLHHYLALSVHTYNGHSRKCTHQLEWESKRAIHF